MSALAWSIGAEFTATPAHDFLSFHPCAISGLRFWSFLLWAKPAPGETKILAGDFFAVARKCGRIYSEIGANFS